MLLFFKQCNGKDVQYTVLEKHNQTPRLCEVRHFLSNELITLSKLNWTPLTSTKYLNCVMHQWNMIDFRQLIINALIARIINRQWCDITVLISIVYSSYLEQMFAWTPIMEMYLPFRFIHPFQDLNSCLRCGLVYFE